MKGYGAELLDDIETYIGRFVYYPSEEARASHVLWIAHTHLMQCWESTPRIGFLSEEPGSGKSRALEVTEPLVPRPVHAVNTTPAYLFRKVSDEAGAPTILFDEIDTVFGPKAKDNEDIRGMLNAGHRRGATAGRCVVRGKTVETEELPAYCAVALAGLRDLPDTILTRTVVIRMRRRAPHERVEPFRRRVHFPEGEGLRKRLEDWAADIEQQVIDAWPEMPPEVVDRAADKWESLFAVADAAGDDWPTRARVAAVTDVTAFQPGTGSLGLQLLGDLHDLFKASTDDVLPTSIVLAKLIELEESPWADLRGKPLDARSLAKRLRGYEIRPGLYRVQGDPIRGYRTSDLRDAWSRYLPPQHQEPVTAVTPATDEPALLLGGCDDCGFPTDSDEHARICSQGWPTAVTA